MNYLAGVIDKLTNIIPAIMGPLGLILPAAREAVISILRLVDLILACFGKGDLLDPVIAGAIKLFDLIEEWYDKAKDFFVKIGT